MSRLITKQLVYISSIICSFAIVQQAIASSDVSEDALRKISAHTNHLRFSHNNNDALDFLSFEKLNIQWSSTDTIEKTYQFLDEYKQLYKITNTHGDLKVRLQRQDKFGMSHVLLQQYFKGIPVENGALKFHYRNDGSLSSINGSYISDISLNTEPTISKKSAYSIVRKEIDHEYKNFISKDDLKLYNRQLVILNGDDHILHLAWRLSVSIPRYMTSWDYYIDAHTGQLLKKLNNVAEAFGEATYVLSDCNATETLTYDETGLVGTTDDTDASAVHSYVEETYNYFFDTTNFGIDSYDSYGHRIDSYTHLVNSDTCSDEFNAGWDGTQELMYFSQGVYAQDIIGHEFMHAVIDNTIDLDYRNESGALDESYADIFGAMVEYNIGAGDWIIGEDLTSTSSGCITALRALSNPSAYTGDCDGSGDALPEHIDDQLSLSDPTSASDSNDYGYVHTNSSITNYVFYLLSEGGTHSYSGISVTGIGRENAEQIYIELIQNEYLNSDSDFSDAYNATMQSCLDLNASDSTTYPISYCESVFDAFAAVGINTDTSYAWADLSASTTSGAGPLTITFDGTGSTAINSTINSYVWDFGDGSTDTGDMVSYTYSNPGTYTATLTITDSNGYTNTASTTITVYASSDISSDTTWSSTYSPYVIDGSIAVDSGYTLTIEPGVVVKLYDSSSYLTVNGTLDAQGTSTDSIVFTSYKDDDYGGDTNDDGTTTTPAAGDWYCLSVASGATATLDYVTIQYGGYYGDCGMITVDDNASSVYIDHSTLQNSEYYTVQVDPGSTTTIINSTISGNNSWGVYITGGTTIFTDNVISLENSYGYGMYINNATVTVTNNTIQSNTGIYLTGSSSNPTISNNTFTGNTYPIIIYGLPSGTTLTGNTGSGNTYNAIRLGGSMTGDFTLDSDNDLSYMISGLTVSSGTTLTVMPGLVVKFYNNSSTLNISGTLVAQGTSSDPIIFTSIKDDANGGDTNGDSTTTSPNEGDWYYLKVASNATALLEYVTIQYGGYDGSSNYSMFWVDDNATSVTVNNSTFQESEYSTVQIDPGSTTVIENSTITSSVGETAVDITGGATTLNDNLISSSGTWGVGIIVDNASPIITGNIIINAPYGIYTSNGATPTLSDNLIYDNTYGLYNADSTVTITAENNWWGDASGPYHATSNPSGTGDTVSSYVDFDPWLTSDPTADTTPPSDVTLGTTRKDVWAQTITLNWTNPTDSDFDHIQIDRTDVIAGTTTTLSSSETSTSYIDTTPNYKTTYTYTLYAVDTSGNTSTGVTTSNQRLRNPTPTNLTLTAGDTTITATWNTSSASPATLGGYKIYYGTSRTSLTDTIDVGNATAYTITGLTNYTRYYVAVTAYNKAGTESDLSQIRASRPHP